MQHFAILVAGGSGSRMKSDLPKQFMPISGRPILLRTLDAFRAFSPELHLTLVLPEPQFEQWKELCQIHGFTSNYQLVAGGATRYHSVQNGLRSLDANEGLVAIHDGVRPFVSTAIIAASFQKAEERGSAVTCVSLKDSIREVLPDGTNRALDRAAYRLIQTPQTFRLDWMRQAFERGYLPHFTDCASVLEQAGYPIHLVDGAFENLKITTPEDLLWAEAFLNE